MPTSTEVAILSAPDARVLTDRIKVGVEAVWELVTQAYTQRAWSALGYRAWDDYCTREFGSTRLRLPREERAEVVASLRESGLSVRAIAAATNEPRSTVSDELSRVRNRTRDSNLTGVELIDGKVVSGGGFVGPGEEIPCDTGTVVAIDSDEKLADCIHCGETLPLTQLYEGGQGYECDPCVSPDEPTFQPEPLAPQPKPITGLDGKTYQPKPAAPKEPRRKPLVDTARDLGLDVAKLVKRIEDFGADDRLGRNRNEVAPRLRHHLDYAIKAFQDLNHQLTEEV